MHATLSAFAGGCDHDAVHVQQWTTKVQHCDVALSMLQQQ